MRKLLTIAVASTLLMAGLTTPAQAATPKAGAACAKAGITQVVKAGTKSTKFTCVKSGKKLVWNKGVVTIAKPAPAPEPTQSATPTPTPTPEPTLAESGIFESASVCQLADARFVKRQPNNVGFPLQPDIIPTQGVANLIVIPVDFSDRPGSGDPSVYLKQQTDEMRNWYKLFSADKLDLNFQIGKSWVRAPKTDSEYSVAKGVAGGAQTSLNIERDLAQGIIQAAGTQFDYTGVHGVFFYFPTITGVDYDMGARGVPLTTPQGSKSLFFWGGGKYHFDDRGMPVSVKKAKMWAFWIHEMLHSQGLALHAPGNGYNTGLAQNQYGTSLVLSAWDIFRMSWAPDKASACVDASKTANNQLVLSPIESGSASMRFGLVKLNPFEVLVIESRRPVGYSKDWSANETGVLVYRVDVRLDNDRSGEATGDMGNTPTFAKWGFYLAPNGKDLSNVGGYEANKHIFFAKGDSVTYGGVKVSVVHSVSVDVVKVEKVG
jgi:hypothetical protein